MKKLALLILSITSFNAFSQGCDSPLQFCSGTSYNLPLTTGGTSAPVGPNYGCMLTQPNPTFFYFQISSPGNLTLNVAGSGGGDVDVVCWGPLTSPFLACSNAQLSNSGSIAGCSYSTSATETLTISNAVNGQFYVMCVTNYANIAQNLVLTQTGGTGSTYCNTSVCNIATPASICFVNTNSTPNNEIYFNHTAIGLMGTVIYRQNALSNWDSIGYVPATQPDEFTDLTATPNQQDYTYCIAQLDSCGNMHAKSPSHTTILLQSSLGTSGQVNLSWNPYLGINVSTYYIYRGATPTGMSLLGQVSPSTHAYTDLSPLPGNNYYKVAVPAPAGCTSNASPDTLIGSNYRTANVLSTSINYIGNNTDEFSLYPNPAKNSVIVYSTEMAKSIEILDVLGNSVLTVVPQSNKESISLQNLNKGVYFIRSTNSKGIFCKKLLIE